MRIRNKRESSEMFGRGLFGNYCRQWSDIDSVRASGYDGLLVLRTRSGLGGGGRTVYNLTVDEASRILFDPSVNYFNEQMNHPSRRVVINGETCRTWRGLELRYNTVDLPMRDALAHPGCLNVHGLSALETLRNLCCSRGFDCIMELLDEYDGHVVEFTAFDKAVGALKWRTIIWEVRSY